MQLIKLFTFLLSILVFVVLFDRGPSDFSESVRIEFEGLQSFVSGFRGEPAEEKSPIDDVISN